MTTNKVQNSAPRTESSARQRFSDRIEFRRGKRDAECGRAPACLATQYVAGYAQGRKNAGPRPASR